MPRRRGKGGRKSLSEIIEERPPISERTYALLNDVTEPSGEEDVGNLSKDQMIQVAFRDGTVLVYRVRRSLPETGPRMRVFRAELSDRFVSALQGRGFSNQNGVSLEGLEASRLAACERQEVHGVADYVDRRSNKIIPGKYLFQRIRSRDGREVEVIVPSEVESVEVLRTGETGGSAA
jgi:hypothetical protein